MKKAFTIIELLVVVAILAILSAIAIMSFSSSQKRAREARRISDVGQISDALQQYVVLGNNVPAASSWPSAQTALAVLVNSGLISSIPDEQTPQGTASDCTHYLYAAPTNSNINNAKLPDGVTTVGQRQYILSFHSEILTTAPQTHPMNTNIVSLVGGDSPTAYAPSADCNYQTAWLLGPK